MTKVAVKHGANVLPGCTFGMIDTDRLSTVEDGLFQAGLDGTATIPITNNSSEGMYLESGDEIGEVDLIDLDEVMQVGDEGTQAAIDTLTMEQQTAVEMHRAEVTFRQRLPRITEPTEIRKLFESWGGTDAEPTENVETRSTESHKTKAHEAQQTVEMAKTKDEPNREPQLDPFAGTSGNTGGDYSRDASFRTGCNLAPGNIAIGSKPAQILCDVSSLSTHENATCEAKTYEEYLDTVDTCATVEEYQAAVKSVTTSPATSEACWRDCRRRSMDTALYRP